MSKKSNAKIDFDRVWAAISRSTTLKAQIVQITEEVRSEAARLARADAFDEGDYADGIELNVVGAKQARAALRKATSARARKRSGAAGKNKFIDVEFSGDIDGGAYDGSIGIIAATEWKSLLIEFGSIARNPSFIFRRAAEAVTKPGVEFIPIVDIQPKSQDLEELGRRISEARRRK